MGVFRVHEFDSRIIWIGVVRNRDRSICSESVDSVRLGFSGISGDAHFGSTRPACGRFGQLYRRGEKVRNVRQLSITSSEDLAAIAHAMGLDQLQPELLGSNLVVSGIPDFSLVPPSSRLQCESGATLVVDQNNRPCKLPGREISERQTASFVAAASHRRGVTAWVERPGVVSVGDRLRLLTPETPRQWPAECCSHTGRP